MSLLYGLISNTDVVLASMALQILTHMLKQIAAYKRKNLEIEVDVNYLLDSFEENCLVQENHLVGMSVACLLSEILQSGSIKHVETIMTRLSTPSALAIIVEILTPRANRQDELKKLEGSGYGCLFMGFSDGIILLLQRMLAKSIATDSVREFIMNLNQSGIPGLIVTLVNNLSPRCEISPKGLISLLTFIHDAIYEQFRVLLQTMVHDSVIKNLALLLKENQLASIQEWPVVCGGGPSAVSLIIAQVLRIFNLPHSMQNYAKELELFNRECAESEVIALTLSIMKYLSREHLGIAVSLLSKMIVNTDNSKPFSQQFVQAGGMGIISKFNLLSQDNPTHLLVDILSLISQLARLQKENYELIHDAGIYADLRRLIEHRDSTVRSKVCNLIGNICRHSSFFYDFILEHGLITCAINCCKDPDRTTRKFACFAVGNAGFHNSKLYEHLRPCVPLLVDLLNDEEEKTRANAAGALGNLVRNSDLLCLDLIKHGALKQLLEVVKTDPASSQSPRQVALFSIGNLCVYHQCKEEFERLNIRQITEPLLHHRDQQVLKYATRILQKLGNI